MSIIKSFSVGNGDMYYIDHNSDNFTVIDCYLHDEEIKDSIIKEIKDVSKSKNIRRFISTHPDEDHIEGLQLLDNEWNIINFYCVKNEATKEEESEDFKKYCELRDGNKAFYIYKGCSRKWMNISDNERGSSGINILWPKTDNEEYKKQLEAVKEGESPNNISPIIKYSIENGATALWMGDIETEFLEKVKDDINFAPIDILFAPHHGRKSGKVPNDILEVLAPKVIVIGEAPSKNLNYYSGYNTIKQNSAGNIIFECVSNKVHIYVGNSNYSEDFLNNEEMNSYENYIGSFDVHS